LTVNTVKSLLKVGEVKYNRYLELLALFQDISEGRDLFVA